MVDLKEILFKTLYGWMVTFDWIVTSNQKFKTLYGRMVTSIVLNFSNFLEFMGLIFLIFYINGCCSYILLLYFACAPLCFLIILNYLQKKKN